MTKANLENKLLAVVRVRGTVKVRQSIKETLNRLNLKHVNNMVLIQGTPSNLGMLKKCNDFVTYGPVNEEIVSKILQEKAAAAKPEFAKELLEGKKSPKELALKMPFHMKPPRHGYEGVKYSFSVGGALGNRGEKISLLIKRML